jgi:DNA-binding transcriptional MocR family regulator
VYFDGSDNVISAMDVQFGMPELVDWLKKDLAKTHGKDVNDASWSICVTTGSQDAIGKTLDTLLNDGDHIIVENPTYPFVLSRQPKVYCTDPPKAI